jgi:hypothetical protein
MASAPERALSFTSEVKPRWCLSLLDARVIEHWGMRRGVDNCAFHFAWRIGALSALQSQALRSAL